MWHVAIFHIQNPGQKLFLYDKIYQSHHHNCDLNLLLCGCNFATCSGKWVQIKNYMNTTFNRLKNLMLSLKKNGENYEDKAIKRFFMWKILFFSMCRFKQIIINDFSELQNDVDQLSVAGRGRSPSRLSRWLPGTLPSPSWGGTSRRRRNEDGRSRCLWLLWREIASWYPLMR